MRAGHAFSEIKSYTIDQMMLFYSSALQQRINYMADVRCAVWADSTELDKYTDSIIEK